MLYWFTILLVLLPWSTSAQTTPEAAVQICAKHNVMSSSHGYHPLYRAETGWEGCNRVVSQWSRDHFHRLVGDIEIDRTVSNCDQQQLMKLLGQKRSAEAIAQKDCDDATTKWKTIQNSLKQTPALTDRDMQDKSQIEKYLGSPKH